MQFFANFSRNAMARQVAETVTALREVELSSTFRNAASRNVAPSSCNLCHNTWYNENVPLTSHGHPKRDKFAGNVAKCNIVFN